MFGISFPELAVVFVVALLIFGPDKLPELARSLGKLMADLKRNSDALRREFYNASFKPADDPRDPLRSALRDLTSIKSEVESELHRIPASRADTPPLQSPATATATEKSSTCDDHTSEVPPCGTGTTTEQTK